MLQKETSRKSKPACEQDSMFKAMQWNPWDMVISHTALERIQLLWSVLGWRVGLLPWRLYEHMNDGISNHGWVTMQVHGGCH